ncbi:MAG: M23 family metallopeptidase, partial [Proteobacteria bacterium]|nr:M23 family metallopeptidase [Pseudomonadota bacterium]
MRRWHLAAGLFLGVSVAWAGPTVQTDPERPAPGEVFAVRVSGPGLADLREVSFDGHRFPLWPVDESWEGLAAVDRDAAAGVRELLVLGPAGEASLATAEVTVGTRTYAEQRLTVSEGMVTLSPENQARAAREADLIRQALAGRTGSRLWAGPFRTPVEGPVSSPFGLRRLYNGKPKGYHSGLDIAAPRGTPALAAAAGVVALAGDFFYTGNTVFLDHGLGLFTAYFHLDSLGVQLGETVIQGAPLGRVGSTGRSTGAH